MCLDSKNPIALQLIREWDPTLYISASRMFRNGTQIYTKNWPLNFVLYNYDFTYVKWTIGSITHGAQETKRAVWIPSLMGKTFGDPIFICASC